MHNHEEHSHSTSKACCAPPIGKKADWLLRSASVIIIISYAGFAFAPEHLTNVSPLLTIFSQSIFDLMNRMWWGVLLGIISVGMLTFVPRELVMSILGKGGTLKGVVRATAAGVLLDLCSHGILLVGMKLYERGASLGQTMAFLIASPWNSFSLTLILIALVGLKWTLAFLGLSLVIAIISGVIFDQLVRSKTLSRNPNQTTIPENYAFWSELKEMIRNTPLTGRSFFNLMSTGLRESRMILRWIFFGVVLAGLLRTFISPEHFAQLFGPTMAGLGLTLIVATILEVCSEGSMPVAADLLTRAHAPGNAFGFLMTGVSTDYTEILSLKETTKSWKIAFFLPLVTVPQVILLAILLNQVTI